jgi:hypothetical protein
LTAKNIRDLAKRINHAGHCDPLYQLALDLHEEGYTQQDILTAKKLIYDVYLSKVFNYLRDIEIEERVNRLKP